jgi:hypothetical protein
MSIIQRRERSVELEELEEALENEKRKVKQLDTVRRELILELELIHAAAGDFWRKAKVLEHWRG